MKFGSIGGGGDNEQIMVQIYKIFSKQDDFCLTEYNAWGDTGGRKHYMFTGSSFATNIAPAATQKPSGGQLLYRGQPLGGREVGCKVGIRRLTFSEPTHLSSLPSSVPPEFPLHWFRPNSQPDASTRPPPEAQSQLSA